MRWADALLTLVPNDNTPGAAGGSPQGQPEDKEPLLEELPPRHMNDSYSELILPFGSDPQLLEQYTNASGGIRMGKSVAEIIQAVIPFCFELTTRDDRLMEHLDSLAGSIAYKHMLGPDVETLGQIHERGFYIVTASVDRFVRGD
jgi:acyl-coenzyme A thioesterase 9